MIIEYLGHSCFFIEGKEKSVVTDPFSDIGYDLKRVECDFCTVSHDHFDHNNVRGVSAGKIIDRSEDGFIAADSYHDHNLGSLRGKNRIFFFSVDGVKFCHMGDLGEYYSDRLVEEIGSPDVLFIPVGGNYTINGAEAAKFASAIKAKITVPMHYKTPRSGIDISDASDFLRRMPNVSKVGEKIELTAETLPEYESVYVFDDKNF